VGLWWRRCAAALRSRDYRRFRRGKRKKRLVAAVGRIRLESAAAGAGKAKTRRKAAFRINRRTSETSDRLQRADVGRLQALRAGLDFEFDALVFGQALETLALDLREVGEQVVA